MPIYAFQCEDCQEIFDLRASIREKEAGLHPECPACHSGHSRQVITAGLVLRGSVAADLPAPRCGPNAGVGCCG